MSIFYFRFKQPIGEVVMTCVVGLVYLGTLVGVILPRLHELVAVDEVDIDPSTK